MLGEMLYRPFRYINQLQAGGCWRYISRDPELMSGMIFGYLWKNTVEIGVITDRPTIRMVSRLYRELDKRLV